MGHPVLAPLILPQDRALFDSLHRIELKPISSLLDTNIPRHAFVDLPDPRNIDPLRSFSIAFYFGEGNNFLSSETNPLVKTFVYYRDHGIFIHATEPIYTTKAKCVKIHYDQTSSLLCSFFLWFLPSDNDLEIARVIRDELWQNPCYYYTLFVEKKVDTSTTLGLDEYNPKLVTIDLRRHQIVHIDEAQVVESDSSDEFLNF